MSKCNCSWGGCTVSKISYLLLVIGGLNWGLVGVGMLMGGTNLNIVNLVLGSYSMIEAIVYLLVGIATVMKLIGCKCAKCMAHCNTCAADSGKMGGNSMGGGM